MGHPSPAARAIKNNPARRRRFRSLARRARSAVAAPHEAKAPGQRLKLCNSSTLKNANDCVRIHWNPRPRQANTKSVDKLTVSFVGGGAGGRLSLEAVAASEYYQPAALADLRPEVSIELRKKCPELQTF